MRHFSQACTRALACAALACGTGATLMPAPAWSLTTFNLTFSSNNPSHSLSGSFTIDETDPAASQLFFSGAPAPPSWLTSFDLAANISGIDTSYTLADYTSYFLWIPTNPGSVVFTADLVPQFNDIRFGLGPFSPSDPFTVIANLSPADLTAFTLTSAVPAQSPSAVPGPLPLFGAAGAFAWSRRLRRRVRSAGTRLG